MKPSKRVFATVALMALMPFLARASAIAQSSAATACDGVNAAAIDHNTMDHSAHARMGKQCGSGLPTSSGQAAFGAISEIVRMLKADPNTDWSKVNVEALRQHLIDMDDVELHAVVVQRDVPGGAEMRVTGSGRTAAAIKRMTLNHARMLDQGDEYRATATALPNGALITVTARNASDARMVAQIRGLGLAGLMTEGDHHPAHHLAIARGDDSPHGR